MKCRLVFYLFGCVFLFSFCSKSKENKNESVHTIEQSKQKKIENTFHFLENKRWSTDKNGASMGLFFQKGILEFYFSISCVYIFPIQVKKEKITMYWANEMDCTYETDLTKDFGLKEKPIIGKPFADFILVNDSTVYVKYFFREWVDKYNLREDFDMEKRKEGTYFSDSLYLISPDEF